MSLRHLSLLLFVATLALMLPFEYTVTRILGVACLVAFVVTGLFAIATPAYLEHHPSDESGGSGSQPPPAPGVTR